MSPKAVKSRLKLVSQLRHLSIALGNAKKGTEARKQIKNVYQNAENKLLKKSK